MKRWLTSIAIAAGLAAGSSPSVAAPPTPVDVTFEWPCPTFTATLTVTGSAKVIELPGNRLIFASPNQRVTVTSPDGNTATYVITGASHVDPPLPNGNTRWTSTGRNLLLVPDVPGSHPAGLFLTTGNVSFVLDAQGAEVESFSGTGTVLDVCQALS
jgi:hypothetical protein